MDKAGGEIKLGICRHRKPPFVLFIWLFTHPILLCIPIYVTGRCSRILSNGKHKSALEENLGVWSSRI